MYVSVVAGQCTRMKHYVNRLCSVSIDLGLLDINIDKICKRSQAGTMKNHSTDG